MRSVAPAIEFDYGVPEVPSDEPGVRAPRSWQKRVTKEVPKTREEVELMLGPRVVTPPRRRTR